MGGDDAAGEGEGTGWRGGAKGVRTTPFGASACGRGAELRRGGVATDKPQTLRDPRNFAAPSDWDEQLQAYTRGVAGAERQGKK